MGRESNFGFTGGFQAYCCTGFVPSSITNSGNLLLYGQTPVLSKRDGSNLGLSLYVRDHAVERRAFALPGLLISGLGLGSLCLADLIPSILSIPLSFGLSLAAEGTVDSMRCCGSCRRRFCGHHRFWNSFRHIWVDFRRIPI